MKLYFKKIRWRNFLNTGHPWTEIDFTKTNTTLITGKNGNGKSTLLDALTFALYGKPFRNINKPQLPNSINGKDMLVEIEFDVRGKSYLVRRGMKPNVFEIEENGQIVNQVADNRDYQVWLETNLIQMTYKAFTQICVLGKANYTPFMNLTAADRRKIIEDLLDLNLFSTMNVLLKEEIADLKEAMRENQYERNLADGILVEKRKSLEKMQGNVEDLIASLEAQVATAEVELEELKAEPLDLNPEKKMGYEVQLAKFTKMKQSFVELGASVTQQTKRLEKDHAFFCDNAVCPTCSQSITDEFKASKIEHLDQAITDNRKGMEIAATKIAENEKAINDLNQWIAEEREKENHASIILRQIQTKQKHIETLKQSIETMRTARKEDDGTVADDIANLEAKLESLTNQTAAYESRKEVLDIAATLLKDGGIKTKIVAQYIPAMNKILQKYLNILDFYVLFELNETFSETVKSRNMESFSYNSFSEGQKARIELALLFTWRELSKMRNNSNTNLLILDEVFDGSLDAEGGDNLMDILAEVAQDTNIFVISHKTDAYVEKFDRVLKVDTIKNFAIMKEQ